MKEQRKTEQKKVKTVVCSECGAAISDSEAREYDGHIMCPVCLESLTIPCRDCGERIDHSENEGSSEHPLCFGCYDDMHTCMQRSRFAWQKRYLPPCSAAPKIDLRQICGKP